MERGRVLRDFGPLINWFYEWIMANIIIIHGTGGSPEGNWFPWLKSELEKSGNIVFVPRFPTPKNQSLESWLKVFENYKQYLDEDSIVIGHSLGPAFLLSVIEGLEHPIKSAFFVSGFTGVFGKSEYDELNKTFTTRTFDWVKIKRNCRRFFVIHSEDDPYVPLERGQILAKNLGAEMIVVKNAGNINEEFGYTKFELLLEKIKQVL